mmetsp:Transcript_14485/g.37517  ORF Transcript_14485/g.37517 Transcript_14485/m.37517 type:complete len:297 (-) Transcript_14485:944-1834(-)
MPLPICPRPTRPAARPVATFASSYAGYQAVSLSSALGGIGPASIDVWISSPVRSRNPVLMKTSRWRAALTISGRLALALRSSSITPSLTVCSGSPTSASTRANSSSTSATSAGECILGLTTYTEPARELTRAPVRSRSCLAASTVTAASRKCSGVAAPSASRCAISVYMCSPTLRQSSTARPGTTTSPSPRAAVHTRSSAIVRVTVPPPPGLGISTASVPLISPCQLAYTRILSSASTVHAESSASAMVVSAASSCTSRSPAGCARPIGCERSTASSTCRPWCRKSRELGASAVPR